MSYLTDTAIFINRTGRCVITMQRCFTCIWRVASAIVLLTYSITPTGGNFGLSRLANSRDPQAETASRKDRYREGYTSPRTNETHTDSPVCRAGLFTNTRQCGPSSRSYSDLRKYSNILRVYHMCIIRFIYICYAYIYIFVVTVNGLKVRSKFSECNHESSL